jgi:hypothetical protein
VKTKATVTTSIRVDLHQRLVAEAERTGGSLSSLLRHHIVRSMANPPRPRIAIGIVVDPTTAWAVDKADELSRLTGSRIEVSALINR